MKYLIFLFLFFICYITTFTQIQINSSYTPQQLVQDFFIGGGVTVTNVQFQGIYNNTNCSQIGYFSNGNTTQLGMNSGIVLSTGCVNNISQVGSIFMSDQLTSNGLTEITNIAGNTSYDGARLEFDFIPLESPIIFTYIFASEEYPEWVGSSFNDAFGFFISGPNPNGSNYNDVNIALIPNTNIPVTINNVNDNSYSQYYINNNNSNNQPVFDGFTTPLIAQLNVIPCQSYHIKISIADVGDRSYDSGVFLLRNSLATDAIDISITYSNNDIYAIEGCTHATITAYTAVPTSSPVTINWTISGTAINGVDCNTIPNSITIPTGQTSSSIDVIPVQDNIVENIEYLVLTRTDACNNIKTDTIYFIDKNPLDVYAGDDQTLCFSNLPITITATAIGGHYPFSYQWNNNIGNEQSVQISPTTTTSYIVTVTDICNQSAIDTVNVVVIPEPNPYAGSDKSVCGLNTNLEAIPSTNGTWSSIPSTAVISQVNNPNSSVSVPSAGTYQFIWTEEISSCIKRDTVVITFIQIPTSNAGTSTTVCSHNYQLHATNDIGIGTWSVSPNNGVIIDNVNNANANVTVQYDGSYTFTWNVNNNGCINTSQIQINFYQMPNSYAGNDTSVCQLSYNLHAVPSVGVGTWTYIGIGTVNFSDYNNPNTVVSVNSSGNYMFIWTESNTSACVDKDTIIVQFTKTPTSNFTTTNINCYSDEAIVTYTGEAESGSIFNWNWNNASVFPGNGIGPHVVSWNTPGVYTISLTVSYNGCTSQQTTISVTVPTPLSIDFIKNDLLCKNDNSGYINITPIGGTPPYTYQWNNGLTQDDLYNINGGNYSVTVVDNSGCTISNNITINEPSEIEISITPSQHICQHESAYLSISAFGGTPPYYYYWNNQQSNNNIVVFPSSTTTYTAYVKDSNGCQSQIISTTVYVAEDIYVNLITNQTNVCPGDVVMITPVIWGGVGPPYAIYNHYGDLVTSPIYIYPEQSGWYTIRVEDACVSWDTTSVYINVYSIPPIDILADTLKGCQPLTVHFNEINPDSNYSYIWNFGDNSNLSFVKNPVHTYNSDGIFDVTVTVISEYGCKNTKTYNDMITVWAKPKARYTWEPVIANEIKPEIQFINLSTGSTFYYWSFGDGDSSNYVNPYHIYKSSGLYKTELIAISANGCKDTAQAYIKIIEHCTFYAPTSFSPDGDQINDYFCVYAHGIKEENFKLEIYDRWGEIIWSTNKFFKDLERSEKWDGKAKNNEIVPVGTYTWLCTFKDIFNKTIIKSGTITVIR